MIAGVAGGLAEYFNIDPVIIRIIFVFVVLSGGAGILVYIILWIVLPYDYEIGISRNNQEFANNFSKTPESNINDEFIRNDSPIKKEEDKSKTLKNIAGAVLVGLGLFILSDNLTDIGITKYLAPLLLIAGGVAILFFSNKKNREDTII
jgi:phage shock protein PspC (stress-responsive transcriptional regulator)